MALDRAVLRLVFEASQINSWVNMSDFVTERFEDNNRGFAQRHLERLLAGSGIVFNGPNPWDIQVLNPSFYRHVLINGSLGLGEAYTNGWWDCEQIDETINLILRTSLGESQKFMSNFMAWMQAKSFNLQKISRAYQVGKQHYDIGNELYEAMLDERMVYTCGYWAKADNLDDAQKHKLDLVCRKIGLRKGMKILDIGCGWGSFAEFAAQQYGAEVVGITISKAQADLAAERCRGLPIEIRLQDYRNLEGKFDAIVSLGMFEHVGHKNYRTYMDVARKCLKNNARFLLHTIGKNDSRPGGDPWIAKYIFPNGEIPSLRQLSAALEPNMIIEDVHNFGPDYDLTLMAWFNNFDNAWGELKQNYTQKYSGQFYRMWKYYLHACAGGFRARHMQLWQIIISSGANKNTYRRP